MISHANQSFEGEALFFRSGFMDRHGKEQSRQAARTQTDMIDNPLKEEKPGRQFGIQTWTLLGLLIAALGLQQSNSRQAALMEELQRVAMLDVDTQQMTARWIAQFESSDHKSTTAREELRRLIDAREKEVESSYRNFVRQHPGCKAGHLLLGNFLRERGDLKGAERKRDRSQEIDPESADSFNNLAGYCEMNGQAEKAFCFYEKAIVLNPQEGNYYHNFANGLYLLNKQAREHYHLSEQAVIYKMVNLYSKASAAKPESFEFALDAGKAYYSIQPLPVERTLAVWTNSLSSAHNEEEREEIMIHMARITMIAGRLEEAEAELAGLTNLAVAPTKKSLELAIQLRRNESAIIGGKAKLYRQYPKLNPSWEFFEWTTEDSRGPIFNRSRP